MVDHLGLVADQALTLQGMVIPIPFFPAGRAIYAATLWPINALPPFSCRLDLSHFQLIGNFHRNYYTRPPLGTLLPPSAGVVFPSLQ